MVLLNPCGKLQELLENDDLVQRYKANAADYIVGKYNWDDVTDQTLNLYGESEHANSPSEQIFLS